MSEKILTFNAGSSTLKFALYECSGTDPKVIARGIIDNHHTPAQVSILAGNGDPQLEQTLPGKDANSQLDWILQWATRDAGISSLRAVGHRVVHGGSEFTVPLVLNNATREKLEALSPLAPLHQPHNLAAIDAVADIAPDLPQVACFDTAFHSSNSTLSTQYALPQWLSNEGVRRYGFHGLSYDYIAGVLPNHVDAEARGRVIVAHLGSGASLCAMKEGHSVASTMGFTALDGLPMAERCGDLDPGVLLYLIKQHGMDYEALTQLLYHQSGLLGVSGISGDIRSLFADGSAAAHSAIELFVYRIGREIGSLAAALDGLDTLVFTGGIGENSAEIRAAVCRQAAWLGASIDPDANRQGLSTLHHTDSRVAVLMIPTDENLVIARATHQLTR